VKRRLKLTSLPVFHTEARADASRGADANSKVSYQKEFQKYKNSRDII
jgi:hypothetical protein